MDRALLLLLVVMLLCTHCNIADTLNDKACTIVMGFKLTIVCAHILSYIWLYMAIWLYGYMAIYGYIYIDLLHI